MYGTVVGSEHGDASGKDDGGAGGGGSPGDTTTIVPVAVPVKFGNVLRGRPVPHETEPSRLSHVVAAVPVPFV